MFRELVARFLRKAGVRGWSSASSASGSTTTTTSVSEGVFSPKKLHHRRRYKYKAMATLETLHLDNLALKSLPLDKETENFVRQVSGACFSCVEPTPVDNPTMVAFSASAMELLDLPLGEVERPEAVQYFCGNKLLKGSETAAHCYCGHQFGHFSGQLGDGAAMYLGEVVNRKSERWEIQLKGAGLTPYSRTADGRKVLRSSIREFLCSEAMHFLGIPTTRAGTCITSDSKVIRDIFYSGNPIAERCSVVLRIAPTFIRFGSFEIFKDTDAVTGRRGPSHGRTDILRDLLDYTVSTFYPQIWATHGSDRQTAYVEFYKEVVKRTARLVAEWQCVGFCHGVLNTDNMSIVGVTIDYGPYGFMDAFDPGYVCNGSDDGGRYTYENQPEICQWNCGKLGEAIQEAVPLSETRPLLEGFMEEYNRHYMEIMRKKLGLLQKEKDTDKELIESLLETMHKTGADFTNTFRGLSSLPLPTGEQWKGRQSELLTYFLSQCSTVAERKAALSKPKMDPRQLQMFLMIAQSNPDLLAQLGAAQSRILGELQRREKLKDIQEVTEADQRQANEELWGAWLGRYTTRLAEEMEGITDLDTLNSHRRTVMDSTNPRLVLRNYIAQNAIAAAEKGDYSEVRRVLQALERPFDTGSSNERLVEASSTTGQGTAAEDVRGVNQMSCSLEGRDDVSFDSKPPEWSRELRVT